VDPLQAVAWGFGLLEGPRVDDDGSLYFSDVPNGGVFRLAPDGTVSTAVPKRRGVGGIALHRDGGLVIGGRNLAHVRPMPCADGAGGAEGAPGTETRVLHTPSGVGLNDLFPLPDGTVVYGTLRSDPFGDGPRQDGECWRVTAEGEAVELYGGISLTNGIGLSPDATLLYHADTANHCVWAHDLDVANGTVANRRHLVQRDDLEPDGLAVDDAGVVWVADVSGSRSVRAFAPGGGEVDRVAVPSRMVTSICFGGADRRDVFIVTADNTADHDRKGTVYRTRAATPGCAVAKVTI
jgi:gluconolactonase